MALIAIDRSLKVFSIALLPIVTSWSELPKFKFLNKKGT